MRALNPWPGTWCRMAGEVLKVLGIIGALDPHTHKTNQADLQGEGKLEREGVRPQRQQPPAGALPGETLGAPVLAAGANVSPGSPFLQCCVVAGTLCNAASRIFTRCQCWRRVQARWAGWMSWAGTCCRARAW